MIQAEQSVDAQPGVAAYAPQHEAVYARVWPEGYPDLMAARDVHFHKMLTERGRVESGGGEGLWGEGGFFFS